MLALALARTVEQLVSAVELASAELVVAVKQLAAVAAVA
jgi:hypothetical protein